MNVAIGSFVSDESRTTEPRVVAGTDEARRRRHRLVRDGAHSDDAMPAHLQVPRKLGEVNSKSSFGIFGDLMHSEVSQSSGGIQQESCLHLLLCADLPNAPQKVLAPLDGRVNYLLDLPTD